MPKAGVLKINTKAKRRASAEPLLMSKGKQAKVNVVSSPASAPIRRATVRSQPPTGFDHGRVVACAMLGASSVVSFYSSSSSDSSGSESIMASPLPIPDLLISAGLADIPEMSEAETAHQMVETVMTGPRTDTSAGMFLYIL
jgi:hypothetical protein